MIEKEYIIQLVNEHNLKVVDYGDLKCVMSRLILESKEGYKYETTIKNLKNRKNPKWFTVKNPHYEHNVNNYIKINDINVKLKNIKNNILILICSCGREYECTWSRFYSQKQHTCVYCSKDRIDENEILLLIKDRNMKIIKRPSETLLLKSNIVVMDENKYLYNTTPFAIRNNTELYPIHKMNKYTLYNMKIYIAKNNMNCIPMTNKYINSNTNMEWECACGNHFTKTWSDLLRTPWCTDCSNENMRNMLQKDNNKVKNDFKNKGLAMLESYKNTAGRVLCIDADGYYHKVQHCNVIEDSFKPSIVDKTSPQYTILNIHNYIKNNNLPCKLNSKEYTGSSDNNLIFECKCGNKYITSWYTFISTNRYRCEKCSKSISKIALATEEWLDLNNIKYKKEFTFDDCKDVFRLPFDYAIIDNNNDLKLIVEVDGRQHLYPSFGDDSFIITIIHDAIKNSYCEDNNIKLIRIPYWEFENENYINILQSNLL